MNKEKIFGFVALCLLILALLPWKAYKQEHAQRIREPVVDTLPADPLQIRRQRKQPDDPADYGIIITEPFAPTRSEKEIADQVQL
ncbi:MAG: hypothetical protein MJA29_10655, partial [Candidatus Omnitrophica bacterium]|nr:hypothetical protein [Candidatus Omnitrophota bacterium]